MPEQALIKPSSTCAATASSRTNMKISRKKDNTETPGSYPPAKEEKTKEQFKPQAMTTNNRKVTNELEAQRPHNLIQQIKILVATHKLIFNGNPFNTGKPALTVHINGTLPTPLTFHNNGPMNNKTGIELGELLPPPHPATLKVQHQSPPALTQQEVIQQATHNILQAEAARQHLQPATETTLTTATFSNAFSNSLST